MSPSPLDLAPTRARINLSSLRHNVDVLRHRAPDIELIGVVKANAYGHGSIPVARTLVQHGITFLAVATVPEAIELREAGVSGRILVFGAPRRETLSACLDYDLEISLAGPESLQILGDVRGLRVHVQVDTGMGRLGVQTADSVSVVRAIEKHPGVELAGLWMHFASTDEPKSSFASEQWERFSTFLEEIEPVPAPVHTANSAAIFTFPESVDLSMVKYARVGIALYGLLDLPDTVLGDELKPVMTLESTISLIKTVEKGTPISYGSRWRAPRRCRIATVAAGYADGYPRILSGRSSVSIAGQLYPVAGTICMDMTMVDLGPPDGPGAQVCTGEPVVLFGKNGPSGIEIARLAETIAYEVVCGVGGRVPRIYEVDPDTADEKTSFLTESIIFRDQND